MKLQRSSFRRSSLRILSEKPSYYTTILLAITLTLFPACASKKMSVEEARQVAVSMDEKPFIPPPRQIEDIMALLNQPGFFDTEAIAMTEKIANRQCFESMPPFKLGKCYIGRGIGKYNLGRNKKALDDIRIGLKYLEKINSNPNNQKLLALMLNMAGLVEAENGHFLQGIELIKKANDYYSLSIIYYFLIKNYILIGDFSTAQKISKKGIEVARAAMTRHEKYKKRTGKTLHKYNHLYFENMQASLLEARGMFDKAEHHRRKSIGYLPTVVRDAYFPGGDIRVAPMASIVINQGRHLANNLSQQGRLVEAELVARETLKKSIGLSGKDSVITAKTIGCLADIKLAQGHVDDANKLGHSVIRIFENINISLDSMLMGKAKSFLGDILMIKRDFPGSMKKYDIAMRGLRDNQYYFNKVLSRNPNRIIALLQTGQTDEAMKSISAVLDGYLEFLGEENYSTAEFLALRGMGLANIKRYKEALRDFSRAVPLLFNKDSEVKPDYLKKNRIEIIIERYVDLLREIHESGQDTEFGVNSLNEIFKLFEAMNKSTVKSAVGASMARAAASWNPKLAELVRQEQDLLIQSEAALSMLSNAIIAPDSKRKPTIINDLKASIEKLTEARNTLFEEIHIRFPNYSNFINPKPVTLKQAQQSLNPNEALISIYASENYSYAWAIPHKGDIKFAVLRLNKKNLQKIVFNLRKSLAPEPGKFGDIPNYDLNNAYELYSKLLKPVENGWKDAKDLLVVASGPLGQLPFSVLPTASVKLGSEKNELFANYRKIPWLIRKASITRHPSVSSFITLRKLPPGDPARNAFVGFGDPYFNQDQFAMAKKEKDVQKAMLVSHEERLHVRSIRVTETGNLDSEKITSSHLGLLNRLPDTAEEIKSIAKALDADLTKDIFLGKNASEHQVKTMELSDRRVIAFATHALVPGDLDGLDQPAIALSSPSVTGDNEDGLLTMGEVLKLKLNADWVVLSACNTGAADGAGAEAVSGLGQAFFYAGTRAILVSMWPVETTSAKKLTTRLFQYQKEDKTLSRARALQKSIFALIDDPGLKDEASGKIIASYAHPLFWAPFIIVGEGGSIQN